MEINDPSVPPGFRFHPTEEELVGYYLKRKINSLKIDLDVIVELDLYRMEPWDFRDRCKLGYEEQNEWYFFSHKDKKYPTGTRTNRATAAGFWKATGRDKAVLTKDNTMIGMRKTLVFYKGRAPNGRKTDWIMHEYRLQTTQDAPVQEEGWVVCRAFRKPSPATTHHMRPYYDGFEPAGFLNRNNIMDRRNQYCNNMTSMTMMMSRGGANVHDSTNINGCPSPIPDLASPSSLMSSSSTIDSNPIGGGSVFHHHYSHQDLISPQQQQQNHQFYHQQQIKQSMFNSNNNNSDIMIPPNHQQLLPAAAADISSIPACSTSTTLVNQQLLMNRNTTTHNNTDDDWTGTDAKTALNWKFLDNLLTSDNNFIAPQPPPPTLLNEYNNNDLSDSFVDTYCDHLAEIDHNDQLLGHYQPSFPNF